MVQTPFVPADGLLSLRRNGIVSTEHFHMNEPTAALRPSRTPTSPTCTSSVDPAGSAPRADAGNPARPACPPGLRIRLLNLSIPPLTRELALTVEPEQKELEPGARTSLAVAVTDADGAPVADAELAVVIVDEAILALTGYNLSDPLATSIANRPDGVSSYYGRSNIVLINPGDLADQLESKMMDEAVAEMAAPMPTMAAGMPAADGAMMLNAMPMEEEAARERGVGGGPAEEGAPIAMRTDFNPLAVFAPAVRTDAAGQAVVDVKLPDNLTRYRVMVTAVAGEKLFGAAESNITARLPLMVRPSAPRFLNFGDSFELPIVVQNQTDEPLQVEVALRTANLDLTDAAGRSVEIPANDRREVRFPAAALKAGTARVQIAAVSGDMADAAAVELPVYTPATAEAFAVYGVVDEGAVAQPVRSPQGVFPQFGGLEINTSSTALQALTDAVIYLVNYPFECSEQIASRILGLAALRDVLTAFEAEELPPPEQLQASVERDIARLQQFQNNDGGFPIWTRGKESIPYHSIHVAHALQRARLMDYAVPDEMLQRSLDYLRNIESYAHPVRRTDATRQRLRPLCAQSHRRRRRFQGAQPAQQPRLDDQSLEAIAWPFCKSSATTLPSGPWRSRASAATSTTGPLRPRAWPTSSPPTVTTPTSCCTATAAPTLSCSTRRSTPTAPTATLSSRSSTACSPTARLDAGTTPRRTSSSSWRWIATSTPTKRLRPTSWRACGRANLRRRPRVRRSHHRAPIHDCAHVRPRRSLESSAEEGSTARPDHREGRRRPPLLPAGPALCAARPRPRPARHGLHGAAHLRRRR